MGVLGRRGHTEAAIDLARLAGSKPSALLCEVTSDDKLDMANREQLLDLSRQHDIPIVTIAEIVEHRKMTGSFDVEPPRSVHRVADVAFPTSSGDFHCIGYATPFGDEVHMAIIAGDVASASTALVRVHSECSTGDIFGSRRCDCGEQLAASMQRIHEESCGAIIYLRGQDGRGIGTANKLAAYSLQDLGIDTVDANLELGLPVDARDYAIAAAILQDLGITTVRLMTNNPAKTQALSGHGIDVVERVPIEVDPNPHNISYLRAKVERLGHVLEACT